LFSERKFCIDGVQNKSRHLIVIPPLCKISGGFTLSWQWYCRFTRKHSHRVHFSRKEKRRQRLLFKKPKVENTARYEFYKRVEEAAKEKQRILKKLSKPQYSNFAYFGHKNKPKRNKPYAMKYCKECGIRH